MSYPMPEPGDLDPVPDGVLFWGCVAFVIAVAVAVYLWA